MRRLVLPFSANSFASKASPKLKRSTVNKTWLNTNIGALGDERGAVR